MSTKNITGLKISDISGPDVAEKFGYTEAHVIKLKKFLNY